MKNRLKYTALLLSVGFLLVFLLLPAGCTISFPSRFFKNAVIETTPEDYDSSLIEVKNDDATVKDKQKDYLEKSKNSPETGESVTGYLDNIGQDSLSSSLITGEYREIIFNISYEIKVPGNTSKIEFISSIPKDYLHRQNIKSYNFFPLEPQLFYSGDNYYAKFIINNPKKYFLIDIKTDMIIYEYGLGIAKETGLVVDESSKEIHKYLKSENFIEKDDEAITAVAESFKNPEQVALVGEIYNFVLNNLEYSGYNPSSAGAVSALLRGGGDCTEYSDLFVALCRAKEIAARTVEGYTTDAAPDKIRLGHNWSEVLFDDFGWVPFDTIYDDNDGNSGSTTFDNLKNIYIYTGFERNDKVLFNYHYYTYTYYGDKIEVDKNISVTK